MANINTDAKKINELLTRGVNEIVVADSLKTKLKSGRVLRVKHGVDPTTADLHLGYAVVYEKLRQFQELGHKIVFLLGCFTGRFGDPTDKSEVRKLRSKKEVENLAKNYIKQLDKILDIKKIEVRSNSEWYDKMSAEDLLHLMSEFTVARMLERDMFQERIKQGRDIGLHEPVYAALQGYDSVMLKSDLTVVGTDQKFNELQARKLQEKAGQKPQDLVMMPLLIGTDGKMKMSQSLDNYIALKDSADDMYGKIMSIPDEQIINYFTLVTRMSLDEIKKITIQLKLGSNPRDVKAKLAREIVKIYHGLAAGSAAAEAFDKQFKNKEVPDNIPVLNVECRKWKVVDLLTKTKLASSKSEARRLIEQGGVKIDKRKLTIKDLEKLADVESGMIVQVGKRKFVKIK